MQSELIRVVVGCEVVDGGAVIDGGELRIKEEIFRRRGEVNSRCDQSRFVWS